MGVDGVEELDVAHVHARRVHLRLAADVVVEEVEEEDGDQHAAQAASHYPRRHQGLVHVRLRPAQPGRQFVHLQAVRELAGLEPRLLLLLLVEVFALVARLVVENMVVVVVVVVVVEAVVWAAVATSATAAAVVVAAAAARVCAVRQLVVVVVRW